MDKGTQNICFTMNHVKLYFILEALCVVAGVKVNMQGSLSLGREVVESISYYLGKNIVSGRRSFNPPPIEDPITLTVRAALICKDLELCQDDSQHLVNEYVIILSKVVASILSSANPDFTIPSYQEQLKDSLEDIRKIVEDANTKVVKKDEAYYWTHVVKKINAKFQNMAEISSDTAEAVNLDSTTNNTTDLRHKTIIATAFIERKYQMKLCSEHEICSKSQECTRALNKLLIHFKTMPEDKIRQFIKYFYEALSDTTVYSHLNPATANEFQIILNDMSYANNTPTKVIMLSVLKTVEARMEMIRLRKGLVVPHDILIAHTILSDLDHIFSNKTDAFTMFLNKFYDWLASDVQLDKHVRAVLLDISNQISSYDEDLVRKLINEVKVFLEMTVTVMEK